MRRRPLAVVLLMLLTSARAEAAKKPVPTRPVDMARAMLDSVGSRYGRLDHYRFEGHVQVVIRGEKVNQQVDVPVLYAFARPAQFRTEMQNPAMASLLVSDGDTLTISAPSLHQYMRQPAPSLLPGGGNEGLARQIDPLREYVRMAATATSVRELGRDTVETADGAIPTVRLEVTTPPDTAARNLVMHPRVLWVDPITSQVLRDSVRTDVAHPQLGPVTSLQTTRQVRFSTARPEDSIFQFIPREGDRQVSQLGAPSAARSELDGTPAPGFSLQRLPSATVTAKPRTARARAAAAAAQTVNLSALKGQVVVLDFWATWCGPCRRWMPIVDRASAEFSKKGLKVFAVNLRETDEQVRAFIQKTNVSVPVLMDRDGSVGAAYGASSIPLTVVIGRDGKVVRTLLGAHPEEDLREALREAGIE